MLLFLFPGGKVIQDESDQYIKLHGSLMEGHAVLTGSGNLPCAHIIHAVGPHWKGGHLGEENILYDCVFSHILHIAVEFCLSTVAIPAISAGVFGFPIAVSTSVITEAVKDFLDQRPSVGGLTEIHLLDTRSEGAQAFCNALRKHFKVTQRTAGQVSSVGATSYPPGYSGMFLSLV